MDVSAIIVCAGSSSRMNGQDKMLLKLGDTNVMGMSMLSYEKCKSIKDIVVVTKESLVSVVKKTAEELGITKLTNVAIGGETRQQSVMNGLKLIDKDTAMIAVHDGARPLVEPENIEKTIADARIFGGAVLGVPVKDTIKVVEDGLIVDTPYRPKLFITQTPQVFKRRLYFEAVDFAMANGLDFTDDCQLAESIGAKVYMTVGDYKNIKITTAEDIRIADAIMDYREDNMRIGKGYDVHKLVKGRKLIIGGVEIPYKKGLDGHSDADVLTHAVMDALLGALALGDIGKNFPDDDEQYKDADSIKLLKKVYEKIDEKGYKIGNIDSVIVAQSPKLSAYIDNMRVNIAKACKTDVSNISIKATTEEGLGFTGEKLGISAHCICLLEQK
ncbi:MAG TPA: 2-C-methyl-D-erythritol 2,4-cyclodiphosphate synthase [Clostridiales bacterium]|nr:2-C-methyl-D-erythritol 2,4-cyclodiphosphate synthase [Clostridiales bacterium]